MDAFVLINPKMFYVARKKKMFPESIIKSINSVEFWLL